MKTPEKRLPYAYCGLMGVLALLAAFLPVIALPVSFLLFLAFLILPERRSPLGKALFVLMVCGALTASVGVFRFITDNAAQGFVEGSRRAHANLAMHRLRTIVLAQDHMRKQGILDHDGDGIGSAGTFAQLEEHAALQGFQVAKGTPFLVRDNYVFGIFIPDDSELAERNFRAYAWPLNFGLGDRKVIYMDQHIKIRISDNFGENQGYMGIEKPPARDALEKDGGVWKMYTKPKPFRSARKVSKPRDYLPGDD